MNGLRPAGAPETKSATTHELNDVFDEFMTSFEAFKEANDERLGQIETRMSADVVTSDKVDRVSRALDDQKRALDLLVQLAAEGRARLGRGRAAMGTRPRVRLGGGATLSRAVVEDRR